MTELVIKTSQTLWSSLVAFAAQLMADYKEERRIAAEQARVREELNSYTDRELAEMGFCRSDIPNIADGTYAR